jgi:hypothetical protein
MSDDCQRFFLLSRENLQLDVTEVGILVKWHLYVSRIKCASNLRRKFEQCLVMLEGHNYSLCLLQLAMTQATLSNIYRNAHVLNIRIV